MAALQPERWSAHTTYVCGDKLPSIPPTFVQNVEEDVVWGPFNPVRRLSLMSGHRYFELRRLLVDVPVLESRHAGEDTLWRPSTSGERAR